ncbi:MAG: hypothetical protein EHM28_11690 [Spirochaetaceae bacterium]|nr:MAG: hypothetical protein EHM28_11690 [Spirochaetaceae bacterium]
MKMTTEKTQKGYRYMITGLMLFTLMLTGCPLPDTGTVTEMQGEYQEDARAVLNGKVKQVACGGAFSMVLMSDGTLWAAGHNEYGELGLGHNSNVTTFTRVMSGVKEVACGWYFTLVLKTNGTLWAAGRNDRGQLGTGNTNNSNIFVQSKDKNGNNLTSIGKIACGGSHSLAVRTTGSLYVTGWNRYGALALGDTDERHFFEKAKDQNDNNMTVKAIAAGDEFSMAIKTDGTLWGTGYNIFGQLCTGDRNDRYKFVQAKDRYGEYMTDVKAISCGAFHTLAVKSNGTLYAAGDNYWGQLGNGEGAEFDELGEPINNPHETLFIPVASNASQIAAAGYLTLFVKTDGTLWATGHGRWGQLGTGDNMYRYGFDQVLSGVRTIACGGYQSLAVKTDGTLWVTGTNQYGQLGTGDGGDIYRFERKIALRSYKNNLYVCADINVSPDGPLYSNRSALGLWETFGLIDILDGKVMLRSYATGLYVGGEDACTSRAKANRTEENFEPFHLYKNGSVVAFLYEGNNKYLRYDSFEAEQASPGSDTYFYIINAW